MKQNTGNSPASPAAGQGRRDESHRVAHETTGTAGGENDDRASRQPSTPAIGTCSYCYHTTDNHGVLRPILCVKHAEDDRKAKGHVTYKYERYFESEGDANDRKRILYSMYPPEGYGTIVYVVPVSRWWLVLATWGSAD